MLGELFSPRPHLRDHFGGTLRFMLMFKMIEPRPAFTAYAERLGARPALQRAEAKNAAVREERGLNRP